MIKHFVALCLCAGLGSGCATWVGEERVGYLWSAEVTDSLLYPLPPEHDLCLRIDRVGNEHRMITIIGRDPMAVGKVQIVLVSEWLMDAAVVCDVRDGEGSYQIFQPERTRATPYWGNLPVTNDGVSRVAFTFFCEEASATGQPREFYWRADWARELQREHRSLRIAFVNEE